VVDLGYSDPSLLEPASALATRWNFHLLKPGETSRQPTVLMLTPAGLQLELPNSEFKPIQIDFVSGRLGYRQQHLQHELLIKACGPTKPVGRTIVDLTAGLGRDALLLAAAGHHVLMLERSPIIAALLEDALTRLGQHELELDLKLQFSDASQWLASLTDDQRPDVIYCDPMHPSRSKSALVKKEMRVIRDLVGEDDDADSLLPLALNAAKQRVVVKRPRLAPPLAGIKPHHQVVGKSSRFDVYLK
jgi:16S rRNA (guanine1516-N2)-methyltransferase